MRYRPYRYMAPHARQSLLPNSGRGWTSLQAELVHVPAGRAVASGRKDHVLGMHFGPSVNADCSLGGKGMRYLQRPGDIGVIPAGCDGSWEDDAACHILRLSFSPALLAGVAEQVGKDPAKVELVPGFQLRDPRLASIGWAIKTVLEEDAPSEPLFIDSLATALAVRMVELASAQQPRGTASATQRMTERQLKQLLEYIEGHLGQKISLAELAAVAGMSSTHLKAAFRETMGTPVYRYVMSRRVEHARALLSTTSMPSSQVALAAGFAHQSHMAATMRRILGQTPGQLVRRLR